MGTCLRLKYQPCRLFRFNFKDHSKHLFRCNTNIFGKLLNSDSRFQILSVLHPATLASTLWLSPRPVQSSTVPHQWKVNIDMSQSFSYNKYFFGGFTLGGIHQLMNSAILVLTSNFLMRNVRRKKWLWTLGDLSPKSQNNSMGDFKITLLYA